MKSEARVWFTLCGLNFLLMLVKGAFGLSYQFFRCEEVGEEEGEILKSSEQSNILKKITVNDIVLVVNVPSIT